MISVRGHGSIPGKCKRPPFNVTFSQILPPRQQRLLSEGPDFRLSGDQLVDFLLVVVIYPGHVRGDHFFWLRQFESSVYQGLFERLKLNRQECLPVRKWKRNKNRNVRPNEPIKWRTFSDSSALGHSRMVTFPRPLSMHLWARILPRFENAERSTFLQMSIKCNKVTKSEQKVALKWSLKKMLHTCKDAF